MTLFLPSAVFLMGQATTGGILGTVTDHTGAVLANVEVTILNLDKGISTTIETNDSGNYIQTQLIPGRYRVTVQKPSFRPFVQDDVTVSIGTNTRVDAQLQLSDETQQASVTRALSRSRPWLTRGQPVTAPWDADPTKLAYF
jgi:hypothetical protein